MGKGQLWPFAQSSPPGSHKDIWGTSKIFLRVGGNWFPRTSLIDNQPRRTRRPCPCRQLLPSVAGSGGGTPHRMRSRLDAGLEQGAKPDFLFPLPLPPPVAARRCEIGKSCMFPVLLRAVLKTRPAAARLVTLLDPPAVPSRPVCGLSRRLLRPRHGPSRGSLLIRRAAWAVRRSGLWHMPCRGVRGVWRCWYSGPWPVFPAFPAVRDFILYKSIFDVKIFMYKSTCFAYKKITPRKTARYGAAPCP